MATPPTFVASYGNTAWSTSARTASVTVTAGDLIVVAAGTLNSSTTVSTPTGGGLTYTLQQSVASTTQQSNTYVWTATSPSSQTFTLTMTPQSGQYFAWFAEVWRSHNGVGASVKKTATTTTSMLLSTQGANSAIVLVDNDWNGVDGTTRTWLTSVGAFVEKAYQRLNSGGNNIGAFYGGHHADSGVVGTKTVGMSAPTGQRPSLIALEVLAAPPAATGSLSLTATALSSNVPPAVRVDVNDTRSPGQATQLTIMRTNPDGTQSPVRTADGNPLQLSGGVGTVYDYEVPQGAAVSYTSLEVPGISSLQVTVASGRDWLVHPGIPSRSLKIVTRPGSLHDETYAVRQGVFWVLGRANPVVITDGVRKGPASQLVVMVETPSDLASLKALVADAGVLLFNPADASWGFGPEYIAVGDVKITRLTDMIDNYRDVTMPFQVVDRPSGGSQAAWTLGNVQAAYGSLLAVQQAYHTIGAIQAGPAT